MINQNNNPNFELGKRNLYPRLLVKIKRLHFDPSLLVIITLLMGMGLLILYSASNQSFYVIEQQGLRFLLAIFFMTLLAQVPPQKLRWWAPWLFLLGIGLLVTVLITGHIGKGAQRWLNLGILRFQPSEIMKLALPLMLAWYFHSKPIPPNYKHFFLAAIIIIIPFILTAKQPDLGTAILIAASGFGVFLLVGIRWRMLIILPIIAATTTPFLWHFLHDYQRQRVLTFLDPESDPLSSGYHIIQSKIAIGSGGLFGKGWLHGTQSHLHFLPEDSTDFIFAVCGEEFGLVGSVALISLFLCLVGRGLFIAWQGQDTFTRILAGSLTITLFFSVFINIGMVIGILPVVGLPLPIISYGGTSMVTVLSMVGILMSIHTHRKLLA